MKKVLFLALLFASPAWADRAMTLSTDSGPVTVSTAPATPTLIFSRDGDAIRSIILNSSGYDLAIATSGVSVSTTTILFSTSTSFLVPTNTTLEMDSGNVPWSGALYGVIVGTDVPKTIWRLRTK